jgi:vanillate O-demethylase ferredoxin subunit
MTRSFRSKLLWIHSWTGMTIGVVMLLFAITGAALVVRDHVDASLRSHLVNASVCERSLPLQTLVDRATPAVPASRPKSVDVRSAEGNSVAVQFQNDDVAYLDPCNGTLLGVENEYGGFSGTMDWLHRFRFVEDGRFVGGVFNVVIMVFLVIGGLILWWPSSRSALRARVVYNPRLPRTARLLSLHRVTGIYAFALLLFLTVTAMPLSFTWARSLIATVTSSSVATPDAPENKSTGGAPQSLDRLLQRASAEMPSGHWMSIKFPNEPKASVRVEVLEAGAPHINAKSYLYLDSATGETLKRVPYDTGMPLGRKVYLYFLALHAGLVGGLPYQLVLLACCLLVPVETYSGIMAYLARRRRPAAASLELRVLARERQTPAIVSFEFEEAHGRPLPPFSAGAHIDIQLEGGLVRQYSLCNPPAETHRYVIAVQLAEKSRGGSRLIHDTFEVGQLVEASTPRNHFQLAHEAPRSLLIAGGIGITPILCMAERLTSAGAKFAMHYCFSSRTDAAFLDRIGQSSFAPYVTLHESAAGDRLDVGALLDEYDRDTHIYVCGPTSLNEAVISAASARGWEDTNVHREYFAAVSVDRSSDVPFDVRIASTGEVIHVPADRSALEMLSAHGLDIPSSCNEGTCGTCLTRVLQGEVEHRDMLLSDDERRRNEQFTPCCSRARSGELVLDL